MAGENANKQKMMAADLKAHGVARSSMKCPICHGVLSSHARVQPGENNKKNFSHFDFGGALTSHLNSHINS